MKDRERHYRRLLAFYPRAHRAAHGEEMLGVLLDDAKPGMAETLDLLRGAVQVHWRHALGGPDRRDTLAIVSLLAPVLLLAGSAATVREIRVASGMDAWASRVWSGALADVPVWTAWLIALVLGISGRRWASVALAWLATAGLIAVAILDPARHWAVELSAGWVLLSIFAAVAMTASAGPCRGLAQLGRLRPAFLVGTVAVLVALTTTARGRHLPLAELIQLAVLVVGVCAACRLSTRSGRRAAMILLVPLIAVPIAARLLTGVDAYSVLIYAAPVAVTAVIAVALHRFDRALTRPNPAPVRKSPLD